VSALESHIKILQGDKEALKQQLAATEARAEVERMTTAKAVEAFAALADRLDELAAERTRPGWRRLAGGIADANRRLGTTQ
jgi:hypothetical protein